MLPVMLLLLLMLQATSGKIEQQQFQMRNEDTDAALLCADLNVVMNFSRLNLYSIEKNFIASPIVTCLELENNAISDIHVEAFNNVRNLKYLKMTFNPFFLENVFVNDFKNLEVLILDNNNYHIGYSYITQELKINGVFPKLRRIFLRNNQINSLSVQSQATFPSLTHLYLSKNDLRRDNFAWLPETLEYLDLTSNVLEQITLKNLNNLKQIFLDKSKLHSIYFENLRYLEFLSASSNRIAQISSETFANISSLLYLDISDNYIKYIEGGSFDSMKKLKFLNLSNNAMEIIQGGLFEKLSNLKTLILEKNFITMFPMIGNPSELELISLNCNKIKTILGGTFAKMPLLETLLLHDNEITNIDQEAFAGLEKLKVLTLARNKLSVLPHYWMQSLTNLEELDLSDNQFLNFGNLALSKSFTLKNIYLSNQVLIIETASLIDLPVNATINLDVNFNFTEQCNVPAYYG